MGTRQRCDVGTFDVTPVTPEAAASGVTSDPDGVGPFDPIAGVELSIYALIVRGIAPLGYDQSRLPEIAASRGIDAAAWQLAHAGWNARIEADPVVAQAFNDAYRA